MSDDFQQCLMTAIDPLSQKIARHPLFSAVKSVADLCRFAQIHVFAVYNFMCLIKALQCQLTGNHHHALWLPPCDYFGCRLLHEIIMEEETDQTPTGNYISHFEWYLAAMQQCGADTQPIKLFIENVRADLSWDAALMGSFIPLPASIFMRTTFKLMRQSVHVTASAFAYGRENITEKMFVPLLAQLKTQCATSDIDLFISYFQRHIDLDGGKHSGQTQTLVARLCGDDAQKWQEATAGAVLALESRLQLLDGIHEYLLDEESV